MRGKEGGRFSDTLPNGYCVERKLKINLKQRVRKAFMVQFHPRFRACMECLPKPHIFPTQFDLYSQEPFRMKLVFKHISFHFPYSSPAPLCAIWGYSFPFPSVAIIFNLKGHVGTCSNFGCPDVKLPFLFCTFWLLIIFAPWLANPRMNGRPVRRLQKTVQ